MTENHRQKTTVFEFHGPGVALQCLPFFQWIYNALREARGVSRLKTTVIRCDVHILFCCAGNFPVSETNRTINRGDTEPEQEIFVDKTWEQSRSFQVKSASDIEG